jgi:hypothetical protein
MGSGGNANRGFKFFTVTRQAERIRWLGPEEQTAGNAHEAILAEFAERER